jgi:hypothetical protein
MTSASRASWPLSRSGIFPLATPSTAACNSATNPATSPPGPPDSCTGSDLPAVIRVKGQVPLSYTSVAFSRDSSYPWTNGRPLIASAPLVQVTDGPFGP